MARRLFPVQSDRLAYDPGTDQGSALRSLAGLRIVVYEDEDATTLADIQTVEGDEIEDSVLTIGEDSLIPRFLGPDDAEQVWGQFLNGSLSFPLDADLGGRIDEVEDLVTAEAALREAADEALADQITEAAQSTATVVHDQMIADSEWIITHAWPGGYPSVTAVDSTGRVVEPDVEYLSTTQIRLSFTSGGNPVALGGKAYLN